MTWNINRGTARDLPRVRGENVDVALLCEAAAEVPVVEPPVTTWDSVGDLRDRALVLAGLTQPVEALAARGGQGRWTIAGTTGTGIGVLGIWTCPETGGRYGPEVTASLDAYSDLPSERPCIVAGDFNVAPLGTEDNRTGSLGAIFEQLEGMGYTSAYHHFHGEAYGQESRPTYFHRYREDSHFHIDFVFTHADLTDRISEVRVGGHADWVAPREGVAGHSDHVPIILDFR